MNAPARHIAALGARMGEEWKAVYEVVRHRIGSGMLVALIGNRGTGKTQLAVEICFEAVSRAYDLEGYGPKTPAFYMSAMDFFLEIKSTFRKNSEKSEKDVISNLIRPSLLIIDEITVRGESKWEDDLLINLIDKRYNAKGDTILIGNLKPSELAANIGASIASRLQECGGIIECNWPSFRSR